MEYIFTFLIVVLPLIIGSIGGLALRAVVHVGSLQKFDKNVFIGENLSRMKFIAVCGGIAYVSVGILAVTQGEEVLQKALEILGIGIATASSGVVGLAIGFLSVKFYATDK